MAIRSKQTRRRGSRSGASTVAHRVTTLEATVAHHATLLRGILDLLVVLSRSIESIQGSLPAPSLAARQAMLIHENAMRQQREAAEALEREGRRERAKQSQSIDRVGEEWIKRHLRTIVADWRSQPSAGRVAPKKAEVLKQLRGISELGKVPEHAFNDVWSTQGLIPAEWRKAGPKKPSPTS
jgi:hypothetical protein